MKSELVEEIFQPIEARSQGQPATMEFEMAYQARIAIDRIRFAIKHTEQFAPGTDQMRDVGLQLLDGSVASISFPAPDELPLTVRGAATYLGVSRQTVCLWLERRQIPHLRVMGRNIWFLKSDLERSAQRSNRRWEMPRPSKHDGSIPIARFMDGLSGPERKVCSGTFRGF